MSGNSFEDLAVFSFMGAAWMFIVGLWVMNICVFDEMNRWLWSLLVLTSLFITAGVLGMSILTLQGEVTL